MTLSEVRIQGTPNPNAKKFIVNKFVKNEGKASFGCIDDCAHVDIARELFLLSHVSQVHLYDNVITVTQDGSSDWSQLSDRAQDVIARYLPAHDPNFVTAEDLRREGLSPELRQIEEILDRYIRPSLRRDGGDVTVVSVTGSMIAIKYEGACGTCPSSELGTLEAIKGALRDEFHADVVVVTI